MRGSNPHPDWWTGATRSSRYGVALIATTLGLGAKLLLAPLMTPNTFVTSFAAVLASAIYGGLGPGLLATGLSMLIDAYCLQPLTDPLTPSRITLFLVVGSLTSWGAGTVRAAYRRLGEAEQRYRRLFESDMLGIAFGKVGGTITAANERCLQLLGYARAELDSGTVLWGDVTLPEQVSHGLREIATAGVCPPFEGEVVRKDGTRVPVLLGGAALDAAGTEVVAFFLEITKRKQAEQALAAAHAELEQRVAARTAELQRSEERFANAFEHAPIGIALAGLDGRNLRVNRAFCQMLGYDEAELLAMPAWEFIHPDDMAPAIKQLRRLLEGDSAPRPLERRFRHKLGHEIRGAVTSSVVRGTDGTPLYVITQAQDISERKRAEERLQEELVERTRTEAALRASEERYRAVVEDQTEIICRFTADGTLTFVNEVFCRFFGKTSEELLGKKWQPLTVAGDVPLIEEQLRALSPTNPVVVIENRVYSGQGDARWMQFVNRSFFDAEGQLGETQSVGRDVTEGKVVEAALRASELRFSSAFAYAPIGMALVGLDGRPFQVNRALCEMLGYSEAELLARAMFELIHPDDLLAGAEDRNRLIAGEIESYRSERRYHHKSGRVIYAELSGSLVYGHDGAFAHYILELNDVTATKHAQTRLKESEERFALAVAGTNDGLWDWTMTTGAIYLSPRCKEILGLAGTDDTISPEEWMRLIHGDDVATLDAAGRRHVVGQTPHFEYEYRLRSEGTGCRWVQTRGRAVRDATGKVWRMVGSLTDITARRQLGEILRALITTVDLPGSFGALVPGLRALVACDQASVALYDRENQTAILAAVDRPTPRQTVGARLPIDGLPVNSLREGRPYLLPDLSSEPASPVLRQRYQDGLRSGVLLPLMTANGFLGTLNLAWHKPGGCREGDLPVLQQIADALALALERNRLFETVRESHTQLQTISRELLRVQEAERRHLAAELHDEIGQTLTGISLMLGTLNRLPAAQATDRLAQTQTLVNDLVIQVRSMSLDLRPAMLDDLGLLPALLWLFGRYSEQTNVQVAFAHRGLECRLAPEIATAAFRIVQEALTNVARHAKVGEVEVSALAGDTELVVQVTDSGSGFDPRRALEPGSNAGIAGMRERVRLLRGEFTIESAPGAGTTLRAQLPLTNDDLRSDHDRDDLRG